MLFLVKAVICSFLLLRWLSVLLLNMLWAKTLLVGSLLFESCAFEHVCHVATKLNQTFLAF